MIDDGGKRAHCDNDSLSQSLHLHELPVLHEAFQLTTPLLLQELLVLECSDLIALCRVDLLNAAIHGKDVGAVDELRMGQCAATSTARVVRTADRAGRRVRGASERGKPWTMRRGSLEYKARTTNEPRAAARLCS